MFKLYNKTFNNDVMPEGASVVDAGAESSTNINYNTYLMLTPLFKSLITSTTAGGEYNLKVTDNKNGFYFYYHELNLKIKCPLTVIFNTNAKTSGILGIKFVPATYCPSRARGLCQLDDPEDCYAYSGERQNNKKANWGAKGMNSLLNGLLSQYYWALFNKDARTRQIFRAYCKYYNINTIRFNLSGDFKDINDIKNISYLAEMGLKLTGYTARDDLRAELLDLINKHDNIILNGSNMMYNNVFNAVDNIKEYLSAEHQCMGGCLINGCLNCYTLKGVNITVLIHGARAGIKLNTIKNRQFISAVLKLANINLSPAELNCGADLYRNINKLFKAHDLYQYVPSALLKTNKKSGEISFNGHSAFINYIRFILTCAGVNAEDIKGGI